MPFGGSPVRLPRTWRLIQKEKEIFVEFGLSETDDGITSWVEIIPLLELRINAIPVESQPAKDGSPLKIFFGADSFRLFSQKSVKATLCVCKPMITRLDKEGHRLQGWAINSAMNNVKMAIYEGGDSYVELCTKGSQVRWTREFPVSCKIRQQSSISSSRAGCSQCVTRTAAPA